MRGKKIKVYIGWPDEPVAYDKRGWVTLEGEDVADLMPMIAEFLMETAEAMDDDNDEEGFKHALATA